MRSDLFLFNISYRLNSLQGALCRGNVGRTVAIIKRDTRSVGYGLCEDTGVSQSVGTLGVRGKYEKNMGFFY